MTTEVLGWVQRVVNKQSAFPDLEVKNFTTSFADGRTFAALLSVVDTEPRRYTGPGSGSEEDILAFLNETFDRFQALGVPRLLDAEDMRPTPEKLSVATYCIEIRRRWDGLMAQKRVSPVVAGVAAVQAAAVEVAGADKENAALKNAIAQLQKELANRATRIEFLEAQAEQKWREERSRLEESWTRRIAEVTAERDQLSRQLARAGSGQAVAAPSSFARSVKWFAAGIIVGGGVVWWWMTH